MATSVPRASRAAWSTATATDRPTTLPGFSRVTFSVELIALDSTTSVLL
ncbi:MAG: hypothetical protein R2755_34670 [Acidimicrobiales bacterium]